MASKQKQSPHKLPPATPTNTNTNTSSENEHDTSSNDNESDSDESQPTQTKVTKPHQDDSSESDDDTQKTQPPDDEPKKPSSKPAQIKLNKRPVSQIHDDNKVVGKSKKSKKSKSACVNIGVEIDEDKKGGFSFIERLFSLEDEIMLLTNMIHFKAKAKNGGMDSVFNTEAFYEAVENLFSSTVSRTQIANKIKRLRRKFVQLSKKSTNGNDPVISNPHEYKLFELSKNIWASQVNVDTSKLKPSSSSTKKKDKTPQEQQQQQLSEDDSWSLYPFLSTSLQSEASNTVSSAPSPKEYVNKVIKGLSKDKAAELDQIWKNISLMEHQLHVNRMEAISKQTRAAMKVFHP